MSNIITVADSDISFECLPSETVLDAAERAGYAMPYSCRQGICSSCAGGVLVGSVLQPGRGQIDAPEEAALFCVCKPIGALTIKPRRIDKRLAEQKKTHTFTVFRVTLLAADVAILELRPPIGRRVKFRAGQYLKVILPDGQRRNYSFANAPHATDMVQLHVRRIPGGLFSSSVLDTLAPGSKLDIEFPYGEFYLRDESEKPAVMIATGTGFAPIRAMVEDLIKRKSTRVVEIYWGAKTLADLYQFEIAARWASEFSNITFNAVLSQADESWQGRRGQVHAAVLQDHPSMQALQVFACGNPMMVAAAQEEFVKAGLLASDFFSDPFVETSATQHAV